MSFLSNVCTSIYKNNTAYDRCSITRPVLYLILFFFSDVAIAAPYGGQFHRGLVYIHNGRPTGPNPVASQVLEGTWASASMPSSFGYAMHGGTDVDQNGYPG